MSDLHPLPLRGHDIEFRPWLRGRVYRYAPGEWWWTYIGTSDIIHGPFASWELAMRSALRMLEEC